MRVDLPEVAVHRHIQPRRRALLRLRIEGNLLLDDQPLKLRKPPSVERLVGHGPLNPWGIEKSGQLAGTELRNPRPPKRHDREIVGEIERA
nr:hypothetical protein [Oceaniglobus trochenteri]